MSWTTAIVAATSAAQISSQNVIGKFNEGVNNRNAEVLENEEIAIANKTELELANFDKQFTKLQGSAAVSTNKSGVAYEGTALRIARANMREKVLQENIIKYNSKVAQAQKIEQANFARIKANMARQESKLAMIKTGSSLGMSLLTMSQGTTV